MRFCFENIRISGMVGVLPETVLHYEDEIDNYPFPPKQSLKLRKVMGFDKHRVAKKETTTSDLCVYGIQYMLEHHMINIADIGAIVVVTVSPDYFVPHVSNVIHGRLGLGEDVLCLDIPQGCCGFLYGLMQACMMLQYADDKKIVLCNADVLSHRTSTGDRGMFPLAGDAAAVTVLECCNHVSTIYLDICVKAKDRDAIIIPAGGFAMPCSERTSKKNVEEDGNIRSLEDLHMDGTAVFDFVTESVPPLFESVLDWADIKRDDIDYYLFHQPNKFLLTKLADELEIPREKAFMNIVENIGNPIGASIPINIIFNLYNELKSSTYKCCLSGFGAGLAYGVAIMDLGNLDYCEMIVSDL